ncbi:MAG: hypothetical protein ABFR62_01635 [Bacteroidota bacterium]
MRNFKRLATSLVAIALIVAFSSCEKQPVAKDGNYEVSIAINNLTPSLKKGTVDGENTGNLPECSDAEADYAIVGLIDPNGKPVASMHLPILGVDDGTQTVVVKTKTLGEYTIDLFEVYDAEDNLIWAAPKPGSEYYDWVTNKIGDTFTVEAFKKLKVDIDVLCWQPYSYKEFGYFWFDIDKTRVKTLCFFGDVCTKFYEDFHNFDGSPYVGQEYMGYDFPAIFYVLIKDSEGEVINNMEVNSNEEWYGNEPLCIEFPDIEGQDDEYTFEIYLAYPDGTWPLVYTSDPFMAEDDLEDITGDDGIFDFVVGNCSWEGNDANIELDPYLLLPDHGTIEILYGNFKSPNFFDYFEIGLLEGFDNPLYPEELKGESTYGYCGDIWNFITTDIYDVDIYPTHTEEALANIPAEYAAYPWGSLNWMANFAPVEETTSEIARHYQAAIWMVIHGMGNDVMNRIEGLAGIQIKQADIDFANEALNNHSDYKVRTGDYVVLLFDPVETEENVIDGSRDNMIQLVLTRVDP